MVHSIDTYGNIILPLQCSGKKRGRDTNMADIIAAPAVGPDSLIHGFNDIPYSFNRIWKDLLNLLHTRFPPIQ